MEAFGNFPISFLININNSAFIVIRVRVHQIQHIKIDIMSIIYIFDYKIIKRLYLDLMTEMHRGRYM